jgi:hypothetical protein
MRLMVMTMRRREGRTILTIPKSLDLEYIQLGTLYISHVGPWWANGVWRFGVVGLRRMEGNMLNDRMLIYQDRIYESY